MSGYNYAFDCSMNGSKFLLRYRKVASTRSSCLEGYAAQRIFGNVYLLALDNTKK